MEKTKTNNVSLIEDYKDENIKIYKFYNPEYRNIYNGDDYEYVDYVYILNICGNFWYKTKGEWRFAGNRDSVLKIFSPEEGCWDSEKYFYESLKNSI